jgi:hypothetical protein
MYDCTSRNWWKERERWCPQGTFMFAVKREFARAPRDTDAAAAEPRDTDASARAEVLD